MIVKYFCFGFIYLKIFDYFITVLKKRSNAGILVFVNSSAGALTPTGYNYLYRWIFISWHIFN